MKLTKEEATDVVWSCSDDWQEVSNTKEIVDQRRWATTHREIFLHIPTQDTYEFVWDTGSTEMQDEQPFENEEFYEPTQVWPHLVQTVVYKDKK